MKKLSFFHTPFAAPYKVLLRKRGLLTPTSRSYAPEQHGVQVLSEQKLLIFSFQTHTPIFHAKIKQGK